MKNVKKALPLAALLSACCVSSAFADNMNDSKRNANMNDCRKCEKPKCEVRCEKPKCVERCKCECPCDRKKMDLCNVAYTYQARPLLMCDDNWFVTADFLWWTARQDGNHFAMTGIGALGAGDPGKGQVKKIKDEWAPGFRVGLGYEMEHDGWDVYLNWTWWSQSGHERHHGDEETVTATPGATTTLFSTLANPQPFASGFNTVSYAKAKWAKLLYRTLDLELGRWSWLGKHLAFRPHVGARGAWIKDNFDVTYHNALGTTTDFMKRNLKYTGVGPRAGMNTSWCFGCNNDWSIFGNAAYAVMWSNYKTSVTSTFTPATANDDVDTGYSFHDLKAVMDVELGLRWEYMGCDNRWHMGIEAGWEHHNWVNFNQNMYFTDDTNQGSFLSNQGDLGTYGFNLKVRFDF